MRPVLKNNSKMIAGFFPSSGEKPKNSLIEISHQGQWVLALLNRDIYESLAETLEITQDKTLMSQVKKSLQELKTGRGIPWAQAKKQLGL